MARGCTHAFARSFTHKGRVKSAERELAAMIEHLIVAAPELYDALHWALGIAAGVVEMGDPEYQRACAALAKARGEQVTK